MKRKAIITITDDEDEIDIKTDFTPPVERDKTTFVEHLANVAITAMQNDFRTERPSTTAALDRERSAQGSTVQTEPICLTCGVNMEKEHHEFGCPEADGFEVVK